MTACCGVLWPSTMRTTSVCQPRRACLMKTVSTARQFRSLHARSGQAMVEFAIISFVLTAMLAGFLIIISLGLSSFQNNIAAESAGRVLDEHEQLTRRNFNTHFMGESDYDPDAARSLNFPSCFRPSELSSSTHPDMSKWRRSPGSEVVRFAVFSVF